MLFFSSDSLTMLPSTSMDPLRFDGTLIDRRLIKSHDLNKNQATSITCMPNQTIGFKNSQPKKRLNINSNGKRQPEWLKNTKELDLALLICGMEDP